MSIGERIREIRKSKGISQEELGKLLGVSQAMIAQYEIGKRIPKIETIQKIAKALEVQLLDVFTKVENGKEIIDLDLPEYDTKENFQEYVTILYTLVPYITNKVEKERFEELVANYNKLNDIGKIEARKRVAELTEIPRYTNLIESEHVVAAHNQEVPEETPDDSEDNKGTDD